MKTSKMVVDEVVHPALSALVGFAVLMLLAMMAAGCAPTVEVGDSAPNADEDAPQAPEDTTVQVNRSVTLTTYRGRVVAECSGGQVLVRGWCRAHGGGEMTPEGQDFTHGDDGVGLVDRESAAAQTREGWVCAGTPTEVVRVTAFAECQEAGQ